MNGNRENANNYLFDGIDNNTRLTLVIVMRPNVEAIKEFKVQTNLYSAEQGRNPGGQINVVTKSGSNAFAGVLYGFLRNDSLDANNFFANRAGQPKPPFEQHQFGGAAGGPIVRNRTFLRRLRRLQAGRRPGVRDDGADGEDAAGDFGVAAIYDPLTTAPSPAGSYAVPRQRHSGRPLGSGHGEVDQRLAMPTGPGLANNL